MRKLGIVLGMAFMTVMVVGAGLARADVTWNFNDPVGNVGSATHTYLDTTSSIGITAYGYLTAYGPTTTVVGTSTWGFGSGFTNDTGTITSTNLWGKNDGVGETGLGLAGLSSNEIQFASFIQLDTLDVKQAGIEYLTMGIGSVKAGEGYFLWGSNTLGTPGTLLLTSFGPPEEQIFGVPSAGTYRYLSISATPVTGSYSDILILNGLTIGDVPVPLPPSVLLFGSGLLGLAGWRRFRKG